jgi:hypothetical protein
LTAETCGSELIQVFIIIIIIGTIWAQAFFRSFRQPSLLLAAFLQFFSPNFLASSITPSSHLSFGLPLCLFQYKYYAYIFVCTSCWFYKVKNCLCGAFWGCVSRCSLSCRPFIPVLFTSLLYKSPSDFCRVLYQRKKWILLLTKCLYGYIISLKGTWVFEMKHIVPNFYKYLVVRNVLKGIKKIFCDKVLHTYEVGYFCSSNMTLLLEPKERFIVILTSKVEIYSKLCICC